MNRRWVLAAGVSALAIAAAPGRARADTGVLLVEGARLRPDSATGGFLVTAVFPAQPSSRRLAAALPPESGDLASLWRLAARGLAAGNHGDLYDNRDRGHSRLDRRRHPLLTFVEYDDAARGAGLDYGTNDRLVFDAPTLGNSSTAHVGTPFWGSLPRRALARPGGAERFALLYEHDHLYAFPEHRDHKPKHGDTFSNATPYVVVSQGSSRSDRPFLEALAAIWAALTPQAKAFLRDRRLLASTAQMILRRGMRGVETDEDYLHGRAHSSAFRGEDIEIGRMIATARRISPDAAPPRPSIAVEAEPDAAAGAGAFGRGERLFDTPGAVARLALGPARDRRYVLSAAATRDPNGRPLRFLWRVLRGDPALVRLRPLDPEGVRVEVSASWTEPYPAPGRPDLETHRIDVGLFVDNGAWLSAPAFFSLAFPPRERRAYADDGRPLSIDWWPESRRRTYADPALFPVAAWRDDYLYAEGGGLLGWTRTHEDGRVEAFTRHGFRVVERDGLGRPARARLTLYDVRPSERRRGPATLIAPRDGPAEVEYVYADDEDLFGAATARALPAEPPGAQRAAPAAEPPPAAAARDDPAGDGQD